LEAIDATSINLVHVMWD